MIEQAELNEFKQTLQQQLDLLLHSAGDTVVSLMDTEDRTGDWIDQATADSGKEYVLRLKKRESYLIRKIKKALEAIDEGEFGICRECGEDISLERLRARPVAEYCIDCKTRMEKLEKAAGI